MADVGRAGKEGGRGGGVEMDWTALTALWNNDRKTGKYLSGWGFWASRVRASRKKEVTDQLDRGRSRHSLDGKRKKGGKGGGGGYGKGFDPAKAL